jgi:hypothetical protein
MPNLNTIATNINSALETGAFATNLFKPAVFYGIAEQVKTDDEKGEYFQPAYFDNDGEGTSVMFDDTNAIMGYHRIERISYKADPEGYGANITMEENADMRFIFFGQRNKIKARPENVLAVIEMYFIKEIAAADLPALSLLDCTIEMGDANMDPYSVWDQEFKGVEFGLSPETMLFSIPYRIVSTFNKTCFSLCS